jgi:thiamine transport system permease protein
MLLLLFAPLIALIAKAFVNDAGFTLDNFINLAANSRGSVLFVPPLTALGNSFLFALTTMFIALIIGLLAAYSSQTSLRAKRSNLDGHKWRLLRRVPLLAMTETIWMLPLGASAVTLGFGFLVGLPSLRSTWLIIPLAHSLVAFPFVDRSRQPCAASDRIYVRLLRSWVPVRSKSGARSICRSSVGHC